MNERIKELDKQARLWAMDNTTFPISSHIPPGYTEKFAELIVQECANQATWHQDTKARDIGGELLKYFGVEE